MAPQTATHVSSPRHEGRELTPPPHIAVTAYAANNLGDDLFISALLHRFPDATFSFFADAGGLIFAQMSPQVQGVRTFSEFWKDRRDISAYVIIGGSMFQQGPGWGVLWLNYARRILAARIARMPVFVIGSSYGPSSTRFFDLAFRLLLSLCTHVSVRDAASAKMLNGLKNVSIHPDLAFVTELPPSKPRSRLGISVMELKDQAQHRAYIGQCVDLIESAPESEVVLFSFQESVSISDARAASEVMRQLSNSRLDNTSVVTYDGSNLEHVLGEVGACSRFVSTRFHSMIVALMYEIPTTALVYHPKIADTAAFIAGQLQPQPDATPRGLPIVSVDAAAVSVGDLKVQAAAHFDALDRQLHQ